jgi:uncharacterized phage-associated protein
MNKEKPLSLLIDHNREKLIHCIIFFLSNTKYCGNTKLFKLLYLLDFSHFKQTAKSVTGLRYYAWQMGPVPAELFHELSQPQDDFKACIVTPSRSSQDEFYKMKARCKFQAKFFSQRELKLMEKIAFIFRDARAENMVEVSHLPNRPWDKTIKSKGEYQEIDYFLALDQTPESLSLEDAAEIFNDIEEVTKLFQG